MSAKDKDRFICIGVNYKFMLYLLKPQDIGEPKVRLGPSTSGEHKNIKYPKVDYEHVN